jgi:hypothetical protein
LVHLPYFLQKRYCPKPDSNIVKEDFIGKPVVKNLSPRLGKAMLQQAEGSGHKIIKLLKIKGNKTKKNPKTKHGTKKVVWQNSRLGMSEASLFFLGTGFSQHTNFRGQLSKFGDTFSYPTGIVLHDLIGKGQE